MKKRILLIGRWGKTHAFAKAIVEKSSTDTELYCYMDKPNAGIVQLATDYKLGNLKDNKDIIDYAKSLKIDFAIAVPHLALSNSLVDEMIQHDIRCVGPTRVCSQLETSKSFLRNILKQVSPDASPEFKSFTSKEDAIDYIKLVDYDVAVKPVGVTEGDGVKVIGVQLKDEKEAIQYVHEIFKKNIGGIAEVLIEEKLVGREFTIQAFLDSETIVGMPATRDYKLLLEGDKGLNTPGMGSISFEDHLLPFLSRKEYDQCLQLMFDVAEYLKEKHGEKYIGYLSGQFIKTKDGIKVIEFNVRPGDSEILNIIPILKTDFVEISEAMIDRKLKDLKVEYEDKATVCKYIVNQGFPNPENDMIMHIDDEAIKNNGGDLFYSCFAVDKNVYKPSPRGVAVTAKGDTLQQAYELCEKLIRGNISGEGLWYRKDIGTKELLELHESKM